MTKTLETKKKILNLLKDRDMTISELSRELGLSTATISQHMEELSRMKVIVKIDNEHFKKLKYYKTADPMPIIAKYIIGAVVIIAIISFGTYFYTGRQIGLTAVSTIKNSNNTNNNSQTTQITGTRPPLGGSFACPMLFYTINGSISNYTGFRLYTLNSSNGAIADYVIKNNSSGTLYISEHILGVLQEPSNFNNTRAHYAFVSSVNRSINNTGNGINMTISPMIFNVTNNTIVTARLAITTNTTAHGTYWIRIDGPCGGGVPPALITVGNNPYSGNVTIDVVPYA